MVFRKYKQKKLKGFRHRKFVDMFARESYAEMFFYSIS